MDYIVLDASGAAYSLLAAGGRDGLELTTRTAAGVIILEEIAVELFGPAGFNTDRATLNSDPQRQAIFDWINSDPKVIKGPKLEPTEADARLYKFGFQTGNFDSGDIAIMKFIHGQSGAGNSYHIVTDNCKDFELFPEKLFKLTGHNDASVAYSTFGFLSEAFHAREISGQDYISYRDNLSGSYRNFQINESIAGLAKLTDADVRAFDISDLPPDIDFKTARIMAGAVVVLKQLGFVGDMFSLAGTIAEANAKVEAGDLAGAENVWAGYFGDLAVGGAGAFGGALLAAGFLAGTGVGAVPATLIILGAALIGGVAGGLAGDAVATELHSFVVESFNNGEPIFLDEFVGVYHSRLREEGILEETVLTQALLGIGNPLTGHATAQEITDAVLAQIATTPELLEDLDAFASALARVIERKAPLLSWSESLQIYRTIISTDAGPFCFLPHTPITLSDGTTRPIEAIRPGDRVLSYAADGTLTPARVTRDRTEIARLSAEITKAEARIDSIVYALFDLTPDEIALLESVA